jgi:hypothetical protein
MKNESDHKATKIWCWCAYLCMMEADALMYAPTRLPGHEGQIRMLDTASDAFLERAKRAAGGELSGDAWREAVRRFSEPPSEAAIT